MPPPDDQMMSPQAFKEAFSSDLNAPAPTPNTPAGLPQAAEGGPTPSGDTYSDDDRTRAQNALRRGGFDSDYVSQLFEADPITATANGLHLHERQFGVDAKLDRTDREIAELKQALAARSSQPDKAAQPDTAGDAGLRDAVEAFADTLDLEGKESRAALGAFVEAIRAPLLKQIQGNGSTGPGARGEDVVADLLVESAREGLLAEWPQLKNADVFENVKLSATALAASRYAHLSPVERSKQAMRAAAMVELGASGSGGSVDPTTRQQRLDAQPPRPSSSLRGPKPAPTKDPLATVKGVLKKYGH